MRGQAGHWYMATFAPPGDPIHTRFIPGKRGNHGACQCGQHGLTKGEWNAQESKCWNRLRLSLSREARGGLQYVSSVEVQDGKRRRDGQGRMMLHRHALIWSSVPIPMERVQALALAAGYGCSLQWQRPYSGVTAANYVAKYITKSAGHRGDVPWEVLEVDQETGEIESVGKRATYRTWTRSQKWGVSVQELREHMAVQARARANYLRELEALLGHGVGDRGSAAGPERADSASLSPP